MNAGIGHNGGPPLELRYYQEEAVKSLFTFFDCKYCDFAGLCHRGEVPTKNCRSCRNAFPVENAEWFCQVHNGIIPKHIIPQGCDAYARIA